MKNLFVYGTLKKPAIQKGVFKRKISGIPDALENYSKAEINIDGETYPLIVPTNTGVMGGIILEVSQEELEKADRYETDVYKRKAVTLKSGKTAWVYVKN